MTELEMSKEYLSAIIPGVEKHAQVRAITLMQKHPLGKFKVNRVRFEREMKISRMVGEVSGLERVLAFIKNNENLTVDEIVGFCQTGVMATNNYVAATTQSALPVSLDDFFNGNLDYTAVKH